METILDISIKTLTGFRGKGKPAGKTLFSFINSGTVSRTADQGRLKAKSSLHPGKDPLSPPL